MARRLMNVTGVALAAIQAGCAAGNIPATSSLPPPTSSEAPAGTPKTNYQLSADEKALDCKKLTGRMQIRILEIRDYHERSRTTLASRALQSGSTSVFGGPQAGIDPEGAYAKDLATLEAYNTQLASKGCKTYDLESELQPQDVRVTPTATIKPATKPAR